MNQQQQWPAPSRSGGGGGSVKRARQRMEAGLPRMAPSPDQNPFEMEDPRPAPSPPRPAPSPQSARRAPTQAMPETKTGPGPIGVAISNPTQIPHWPLQGTIEHVNDSSQLRSSPPRGPPPQRPPRPSRVPSILDSSRVQAPMPGFAYVPQQQGANQPRPVGRPRPQQAQPGGVRPAQAGRPPQQAPYSPERSRLPLRALPQQYQPPEQSRNPGRPPAYTQTPSRNQPRAQINDATSPVESNAPSTQSSRPSTTSSAGSIPDFPLPAPMQRQRSINLGPPPSSRRGASSYYSQTSYVSPIPEVSENQSPRTQVSHGSYASSAAIPTSWGDDSPGFRSDEFDDFEDNVIDERGESRASTLDDNDGKTLIRSASLGKRAKPSMVNTRSAEKVETVTNKRSQQKSKLERMGFPESIPTGVAVGAAGFAAARMAERDNSRPTTDDDSLAGGTGLIDKSDSSSAVSALDVANAVTTDEVVPPPQAKLGEEKPDPKAAILGAYNAASTIGPGGGPPNQRFSRLSAIRRPPRLDIDAVRDAEARGSLTSLPDLIRRATRLAYMIDKGKRPGSGMDLNDFPSLSPQKRDKKNYRGLSSDSDEKRQSGLSGMLAAFPPPGPTPSRLSPRPGSQWPEVDYDPNDPDQAKRAKPKRKCCGLSLPIFLVLLFILLIVIAAAIVVPLKLLVLDKKKTNKAAAAAASTLGSCQANSTTACQNGGTTIIMTDSQCGCICINGFTGSTCTIAGATGCTTANLTSTDGSTLSNVTLGGSLPRLISQANTNFSIPLSADNLLARFNAASLSCSTQNALVTFGGQSENNDNSDDSVTSSAAAKFIRQATGAEDTYSTDTFPAGAATTTTSYTTTTTIPPSPTDSASSVPATPTSPPSPSLSPSSSTASTASTASTPTSTSTFTTTSRALDFARIAVLFILQQEDLTSATKAQSALQKVFSQESFTTAAAQNVSMGGQNSVDLVNFTLDVGNGTVGGGTNGTTVTAKMRRMVGLGLGKLLGGV